MFNLGIFEIIIIAVIALVVVGPEKLPGLAQKIGYYLSQVKNIGNEVMEDIVPKEIKEFKVEAPTWNLEEDKSDNPQDGGLKSPESATTSAPEISKDRDS